MDDEQAWMAEPDDLDEPKYWEDEELARWFGEAGEVEAGEAQGARTGGGYSVADVPEAWPRAEGGVPDLIDAVLGASGDPALMTDADLVESVAAWHAVGSRAAGREYRATVELLRRRRPRVWDRRADRAETVGEESSPDGAGAPGRVMPAVVASREAAAEIALALSATGYAAQAQAELAANLSRRLPAAFGELDAGRADLYRVRLLAEAVQFLSDEDAGRVDALLAPCLGKMTTGDLRDNARKAIFRIDSRAADRRREHAQRKARFALYGNDDQTATAAIERMPSHLGAAAKARVNAIARAAKAAGMTDPMALLQAKVATGLLLGTLPYIPPPANGGPADGPPPGGPHDPGPAADPWDGGWPGGWFTGPTAPDAPDAPDGGKDRAPDDDGGGAAGPGQEDPQPGPREDPGPEDPGLEDHSPEDPGPEDPGFADAGPDDPDDVDSDPDDEDAGAGPYDPDFGPEDADFGPDDEEAGAGKAEPAAGAMTWPAIPAQAGAAAPGCLGLPPWLRPKDPGRIRLTAPWRSLTGTGPEPGELSWIGPISPAQARDLARAAAADPGCTWTLIITDAQGRAIAVTTLRTRRGTTTGPPGLISDVTITISQDLAAALGDSGHTADLTSGGRPEAVGGRPDSDSLAGLLARAIPAANLAAAAAADRMTADQAAGGCAHTMQTPGYHVPGRLRRWLTTRDRTCRHPGCRQPASRCDQDHTIPYSRGGRTCPCNLGGLCRTHHQLKQLPGWQLAQDAHGYFTWRTPAGLTYRKEPHRYPI